MQQNVLNMCLGSDGCIKALGKNVSVLIIDANSF